MPAMHIVLNNRWHTTERCRLILSEYSLVEYVQRLDFQRIYSPNVEHTCMSLELISSSKKLTYSIGDWLSHIKGAIQCE